MPLLRWTAGISVALLIFAAWSLPGRARGTAQPVLKSALDMEQTLYLEVFLNDAPRRLIAAFRLRREGSLAIEPSELEEIGLQPTSGALAADGMVELNRLSRVTYSYDSAAQTIHLSAKQDSLVMNRYDAHVAQSSNFADQKQTGAVINYTIFGTTNTDIHDFALFDENEAAVSGAIDSWAYGPWGTFSQSLIAGTSQANGSLRLDTTWSFVDQENLRTYRAGDTISGGLTWTRPIRLAGLQIQRDFALRPDLITMPMPSVNGSAAVPSTVDVYANNVRVFSRSVPAGPFEISNVPVVTGAGMAQVVVHDSLGRDVVTTMPFYASASLLRGGLYDFSIEAGFARKNFGTYSNDYDDRPIAIGTLRRGISDWLTLETHAEATEDLLNGGAGLVFPIQRLGVGSVGLAGSALEGAGVQLSGSLESAFGPVTLRLNSQHTIGNYMDAASVTAFDPTVVSVRNREVPNALDQVAVSSVLPFEAATATLSFTRLSYAEEEYRIVGAAMTRPIYETSSLYASFTRDLASETGSLFYIGVSTPLGARTSFNATAASQNGDAAGGIDVVRSETMEPGSYGWRVREREGEAPERLVAASYRSSVARVEGRVQQFGPDISASAQIEGGVVLTGEGQFFTNRVSDAFSIVDAGVADVAVYSSNRLVGRTDSEGRLLVPDLRSYEENQISIDPKALPIDAEVPRTTDIVVPGARRGVTAKFQITKNSQSAVVVLSDQAGKPLPAGLRLNVDGRENASVVGYDGEAFVQGLTENNEVVALLPDGGSCKAHFKFVSIPSEQVVIPVICR